VGNHWQTLTKETKIDFAEYNNQLINTIAQYFNINDGSVLVVFYDESGQRVAELSSWGGYNILK
jgi:predicted RNA-binding protein with PIN domain